MREGLTAQGRPMQVEEGALLILKVGVKVEPIRSLLDNYVAKQRCYPRIGSLSQDCIFDIVRSREALMLCVIEDQN